VDSFDLLSPLRFCFDAEDDVNAPDHKHTLVLLDLADGVCFEASLTGWNLTRLQRAAKGARESSGGAGDDVVECRRVRFHRRMSIFEVVRRNRSVDTEENGIGLARQECAPKRSLDSFDPDFGAINDVQH
jgi:hypothetical protein